ncbi:hypothetical protein GW17_00061764 [Ensete ventricosum]|nr:hypothetical protein GW17_00061764 [Ensete ventricosum]RZR96054.1 hypothetical protein BHM03_00025028 [Ensete ventricosum]
MLLPSSTSVASRHHLSAKTTRGTAASTPTLVATSLTLRYNLPQPQLPLGDPNADATASSLSSPERL